MTGPVKIGVVTTSRADFSIYASVLDALRQSSKFDAGLIVTGMHMLPEFGYTFDSVKQSGHPIFTSFEGLENGDQPIDISRSMGKTTARSAEALNDLQLDLLMVLGDRFEMHAVALSALPFRIPVVHLHGGEETEGAIDNALRHSMTKLSHLHFCSTALTAKRLHAMGEAPANVIISGAPALDRMNGFQPMTRQELHDKFAIPQDTPFTLVTLHPETLDPDGSIKTFDAMAGELIKTSAHLVFTAANADTAGRALNTHMTEFVEAHKDRTQLTQHMGGHGYFSAMNHADLMIGNSSSGILEAASFGLPVINIGDRQAGREQSANVIDCAATATNIGNSIKRAMSPEHRATAKAGGNIYGDGQAAPRIISGLTDFIEKGMPIRKSFHGDFK